MRFDLLAWLGVSRSPRGRAPLRTPTAASDTLEHTFKPLTNHKHARNTHPPINAALIDDFIALGFLPADADRGLIIPVMERVLGPYLRGGGARSFNFQALSQDLLSATMEIPFAVPPYMSLLARVRGRSGLRGGAGAFLRGGRLHRTGAGGGAAAAAAP